MADKKKIILDEMNDGNQLKDKKKITVKKEDIFEKDEDNPIGFHIKRIEQTDMKHKSDLLCPNSNRIAICGSSGTGKSTLALGIIPMFSDNTTHLLIASVKQYDPVFEQIEKYCSYKKIKYLKVDNGPDIAGAVEEIIANKQESDHYILLLDDIATSYTSSAANEVNRILITCFSLLRSTNGSMIIITQSYNNLPTKLRENLTMRIVFRLGNVYSVRAILDDVCGLFFTGEKEDVLRHDIKNVYKRVMDDPHAWIMILSHPPQIRFKFNEIIYPPEQVTTKLIVGGSIERTKRDIPPQMRAKFSLYNEAKLLGFPKYAFKNATIQSLKNFMINAKNGTITETIIGEGLEPSPEKLKNQLLYSIRCYKRTEHPKYLQRIEKLCEELLEQKVMDEPKLKYLLKQQKMSKYIDF
jgi:hypothetical protein